MARLSLALVAAAALSLPALAQQQNVTSASPEGFTGTPPPAQQPTNDTTTGAPTQQPTNTTTGGGEEGGARPSAISQVRFPLLLLPTHPSIHASATYLSSHPPTHPPTQNNSWR